MVWCARESADFEPAAAGAMQLLVPYGWIHWSGQSWHTVTGYELGHAGEQVAKQEEPFVVAMMAGGRQEPSILADLGPGAAEPSEQPQAGSVPEVPVAPAMRERQVSAPADPQHNAGPAPQLPSSGEPSAWDADHKRDQDRADAQQTVNNTRWDAQHTLDNTRWDTKHTLDNTRWDTQHTLDNTRWDTRHTVDNTRWDTALALKRSRQDSGLAADMALLSAVHGGYVAVAQGSLDRAVQRATYVATAAGAIGTLYTAILAARYTPGGHPALPGRSIVPALFIGAAVAFSTWYMAFLRGETKKQQLLLSGSGGSVAETRLLDFMEWTFSGVLARAWSLRVAVISLALGLALLPMGLVALGGWATALGYLALAFLVAWLGGELYFALQGPPDAKVKGPRGWVGRFLKRVEQNRPPLIPGRPDLPDVPKIGFDPTGPAAYGMVYPPPVAPKRADGDDPPLPAAPAAAADPPPAPQWADGASPPPPPATALGPPPKQPDPLAPGQRPAAPPPDPSPQQFKVDLHIADDRPGKHP